MAVLTLGLPPLLAANDSVEAAPNAPGNSTLYIAALRPAQAAPESTAYGTATLQLSSDGKLARVSVTYSNLTSARVSSHLKLGGPEEDGRYIINFHGDQQPVQFDWKIESTADASVADLQAALSNGLIYVGIDTKRHPTGELRGQFIRTTGSQVFVPPPPAPALPASPLNARDAARFLTQATFGPTKSAIDDLVGRGLDPWLEEQFSLPASSHLEATRADYAAFPPANKPKVKQDNRQAAWWKIAVQGKDQLRQRVAFALSEIFVVSDQNGKLKGQPEALAAYNDLLARDAFGNFRQLLEDVTLSPVMGTYLSHLRNAKGDPQRGTSPDENYARELMQLFTIGINQLQPDGTYKLGSDGLPIPTYDQETIVQTARVFTGWSFHAEGRRRSFLRGKQDFMAPMMLFPTEHDQGQKTIVNGEIIPANQGGTKDLTQTLDALFNHPNTAPFISRQLIQRLVTSNPSPGYVYRVAQVFEHDRDGRRGNLGAVVRAILLDYEARSPEVLGNFGYGKMKEPLLQVTALLRAFDGGAKNKRYHLQNIDDSLGQAALHSPTVFNFFEPDYVLPGPLAAAGLRAPEYQIFTATTAITIPNRLRALITTPPSAPDEVITLNLQPLAELVADPKALLDYLDLVMCAGAMTPASRARVSDVIARLPPRVGKLERARCALDLVVTSSDATIQR